MPQKKREPDRAVTYRLETELESGAFQELPRVRVAVGNAPGRRMISLRLREDVIDGLKRVARKKVVPYQVLIQMWLQERLVLEEQAATTEESVEAIAQLRSLTAQLVQVAGSLESAERQRKTVTKRATRSA